MPKCNTCGSIVSKDDIYLDGDVTKCSFCSEAPAEYRFQLSVTNHGVGISGATPHGEFNASVPWSDVQKLRKKPEQGPPKLMAVKEG